MEKVILLATVLVSSTDLKRIQLHTVHFFILEEISAISLQAAKFKFESKFKPLLIM